MGGATREGAEVQWREEGNRKGCIRSDGPASDVDDTDSKCSLLSQLTTLQCRLSEGEGDDD